jgi:hypothetical protein
MNVTPVDSLYIANTVARVIDTLFTGMDPTVRALLIGPLVFIIFQGWKWVMDPATPPLAKASAWWEQNRAWLNVVLPAVLAWLANGSRADLVGLVSALSPAMVHGIKTAIVSVLSARPTAAGQRNINAAVGILLASVLLASSAAAEPLSTAFVSRFAPTVAFGVVERWEGVTRLSGGTPSPRLAVQTGLNWNDSVALRARAEWGVQREGLPERHQWSGEVGLWYVPQAKR